MKNSLNGWMSGAARFLTGVSEDKPKGLCTEHPNVIKDQESEILDHGDDSAAPIQPDNVEAHGEADVTVSTPPPVEEIAAPTQSPELAAIAEIKENVSSLIKQVAAQDSVLTEIRKELEAASEREALLEGQAATMRALSERVKELESQATMDLIIRPMLKDWINLYDSLLARIKSTPAANRDVITALKNVAEEVLATLARYDARRFEEPSDELDVRKQQVVKTVVVDQLKNNQVIDRPRPGFVHRGQIIRYEHVVVQKIKT